MIDISIKTVLPKNGNSYNEQLIDCLNQVKLFIIKNKISKENILKQTVFINADKSFKLIKEGLLKQFNSFYSNIPPTSFIAQAPDNGEKLALEVFFSKKNNRLIEIKKHKDFRYTVLQDDGIKSIYCGGITAEDTSEIIEQSREVFNIIKEILIIEGLNFSNIIRQWNYIENITGFDREKNQNYQVFNNIRAEFYDQDRFVNGYPAATGIGINAGGLVIEFTASSFLDKNDIISISSPIQYDAHKYSKNVLVGALKDKHSMLSSPKFERAKVVKDDNTGIVYISGTAAIDGQTTMNESTVKEQTLNTIDNIKKLVSKDNMEKYGIRLEQPFFSSIRVYIKREEDIEDVKKICDNEFVDVDLYYVVADICREKLLVEIEGILRIGES